MIGIPVSKKFLENPGGYGYTKLKSDKKPVR